ncbi:hypothetical protein ACHHYP_20710 [Achlya hypogyna]|uniref:Uncharacterized protein n=1 Tax=Achlya hypogyna TaxID=1202772 RepID=A0A1V9YE70_ACHHY|nr:hypothetical protein ACHHYP_20710 [Achlya hypogyna]
MEVAFVCEFHQRPRRALSATNPSQSHVDLFIELQLEKYLVHAYEVVTTANTLASRLLDVFPSDKEVVEIMVAVIMRLTGDVVDFDCLRFINVKNTTLGVRVRGDMSFDKVSAYKDHYHGALQYTADQTEALSSAKAWLSSQLEATTQLDAEIAALDAALDAQRAAFHEKKCRKEIALFERRLELRTRQSACKPMRAGGADAA